MKTQKLEQQTQQVKVATSSVNVSYLVIFAGVIILSVVTILAMTVDFGAESINLLYLLNQ